MLFLTIFLYILVVFCSVNTTKKPGGERLPKTYRTKLGAIARFSGRRKHPRENVTSRAGEKIP